MLSLAEDLAQAVRQRLARPRWEPLPHQVPPPGDWRVWLVRGGRGSGKTMAGAQYCLAHLRELGPRARVGVGAPTRDDARAICAEGPSGILTLAPDEFDFNRSNLEGRHKAGGYVRFLGAEEPGRWNGPQWTLLWCDELALWNEDSWKQAQFGVRLPPRPRIVATTTPKRRQFVRELEAKTGTVLTHATTTDNPFLAAVAVMELSAEYGGTSLGRQELLGEWIEDTAGALWRRQPMIEDLRVREVPDLSRVVVAVDPPGASGPGSAECGIIVAGLGRDGHGYVLEDCSLRGSPNEWAATAVSAYRRHKADRLVAEVNYGGLMVESTIRMVEPSVAYKPVTASRGKQLRAEPIAALYEQGKVHHAGTFPELEDQLCTWVPGERSPDRLDSLVWALTELLLRVPRYEFF